MKHTLSYWVLDVDITLIRGHLRQLDTFPQAASVKLDTLLHVKGSHLLFLRTEWYSKTDHLGVSTAHNNGHKTLTRRGTKPQCLKIPKLFKSMLDLPNIWASKWEICFMQMSTVKKTNECNHQCLWWDHHVCSLCSRGWVNYLENMSVLWMPSLEVLAHIRITTGCLFTEIWLKSAVVAALDAKWITSYSSATLLPDSRRLPAGNIGQIEKLMPGATLPWIYMVQQNGNNVFF